MVIDGGWGTGKTEFCQKLIRLMQQQHPDYQPVYIDAFRSDHSGEPLLALLAEIIKTCTPEDTGEQPSEQRKEMTKKVAKAAGFVMKTVAKAAVGHVLKQNMEDLAEGMNQIINDKQEAKNAFCSWSSPSSRWARIGSGTGEWYVIRSSMWRPS